MDTSRIIQGGILVALLGIGGLLFSIRWQMTPPAPPAQQAQAAPAAATVPPVAPAPVAAPPVAAPAAPAPAPAPKPRATHSYRSTPQRSDYQAAASAPAPQYSQPATQPAPAPAYMAQVEPAPAPAPPPPPPTRSVTVPAGTALTVRLLDAISSEKNRPGDAFQATLEEPLLVDGVVVADRGANAFGRVVQAQQSGRVAGVAEMSLELDRLQTVGGEVQLASDTMQKRADTTHGKDAMTVGGLAGLGAAVGAIAGGRRGAGIGAAAGGATGAGTVMATRGKPVRFDPEARLTFRLRAPITVTLDNNRVRTAGYNESPRRSDEDRPRLQRRN